MATWSIMADVPNPIIVDAAGTAGSGYVLKAYLPGTTTSTSIAIDATGGSPQASITANAEGKWEVSGNEILPHIDRDHKWGIFANATDATANTPFYMGPFDNVASGASGVVYDQGDTGSVSRNIEAKLQESVSVQDFGAVGDGVTNDGTALYNACLTGDKVFIPVPATSYVFTLTEAQVNTVLDAHQRIEAAEPITINLPTMDLTRGTIDIGSAWGQQITVKGADVTAEAVTSVTVDSQSAGDHRVTFNVADESAFTAGGMAYVKAMVGTNRVEVLEGIWPVTSVGSGTIQCKITARQATLPAVTASSGTISAANTIIRVNGANGLDCINGGECGTWQSIALVGDGLGAGDIAGVRVIGGHISLSVSTALPFGVYGFKEHGIYGLEGAMLQIFDSYSSGNEQNGVYLLDGSHAQATRLISTGNDNPGLIAANNSQVAGSQANLSGNGQRGLYTASGSFILANTCTIYENGDSGIRADEGAMCDVNGSFVAGSVSYGTRSNQGFVMGTIDYTGGNGAADEFTENNGYINNVTKRIYEDEGVSGATASALADNIVIDTGSANGGGLSILTLEAEYGAIYFGNDADNDEASIRYRGTSNSLDFYTQSALKWKINSSDNWTAQTDDAQDVGSSSIRLRATYSTTFYPGDATVRWTSGSGTPEGSLTAAVGSMYTRTDGGAGTTLYIKETGAGNTGWVGK